MSNVSTHASSQLKENNIIWAKGFNTCNKSPLIRTGVNHVWIQWYPITQMFRIGLAKDIKKYLDSEGKQFYDIITLDNIMNNLQIIDEDTDKPKIQIRYNRDGNPCTVTLEPCDEDKRKIYINNKCMNFTSQIDWVEKIEKWFNLKIPEEKEKYRQRELSKLLSDFDVTNEPYLGRLPRIQKLADASLAYSKAKYESTLEEANEVDPKFADWAKSTLEEAKKVDPTSLDDWANSALEEEIEKYRQRELSKLLSDFDVTNEHHLGRLPRMQKLADATRLDVWANSALEKATKINYRLALWAKSTMEEAKNIDPTSLDDWANSALEKAKKINPNPKFADWAKSFISIVREEKTQNTLPISSKTTGGKKRRTKRRKSIRRKKGKVN